MSTRQIVAAEHGRDQPEPVAQVRRHHGDEPGRERHVEAVGLRFDRRCRPTPRPASRCSSRRTPSTPVIQKAWRLATGSLLHARHRRRLVDRQLGGDGSASQRAGDHPRHRQPVDRVAGGQHHRPAEGRRRAAAGGDHADGAELRRPGEHEQRHHARLGDGAAGGDGADAEHEAEHADRGAERQRRRGDVPSRCVGVLRGRRISH